MKIIETISITKQQSYALTAQSILLLYIGAAAFQIVVGQADNNASFLALFLMFIATIVVHEMLHGLGFYIGGAKPRFGVGIVGIMPVAYATSDQKIPLRNMLVVAYLPFIVLSILFIVLSLLMPEYSSLFMVGFLANFTGAIGDLWIASKLLKYLRFNDVDVLDTKTGTVVYSNNPKAVKMGITSTKKQTTRTSFWSVAGIAFLLIMFISAVVPTIMMWSGFSGSFKLGVSEFYLFMINTNDTEFSAVLNLMTAFIGGILAGLIFTVLERRNKKH